jgi:hypothetical protein
VHMELHIQCCHRLRASRRLCDNLKDVIHGPTMAGRDGRTRDLRSIAAPYGV